MQTNLIFENGFRDYYLAQSLTLAFASTAAVFGLTCLAVSPMCYYFRHVGKLRHPENYSEYLVELGNLRRTPSESDLQDASTTLNQKLIQS